MAITEPSTTVAKASKTSRELRPYKKPGHRQLYCLFRAGPRTARVQQTCSPSRYNATTRITNLTAGPSTRSSTPSALPNTAASPTSNTTTTTTINNINLSNATIFQPRAPSPPSPFPDSPPTPNPPPLFLRPLQPADEPALRALWLQGWQPTLALFAPRIWDKGARYVALATAAAAAVLLIALFLTGTPLSAVVPQPPCLLSSAPSMMGSILLHIPGTCPLPEPTAAAATTAVSAATAAAVAPALVAAQPVSAVISMALRGLLVCVLAGVTAWALMTITPAGLRYQLLLGTMYRGIRRMYRDMWSMHESWRRPAAGRGFWVVELPEEELGGAEGGAEGLTGAREGVGGDVRVIVGGVALKVGVGVRPLPSDLDIGCKGAQSPKLQQHQQVEQMHGREEETKTAAAKAAKEDAEKEDAAGFTAADVQYHGSLQPTDALLYRVVTHKSVRRRGVGRRLLAHALEVARAAGVRRVLLATTNPAAVAFYCACGFEKLPGRAQQVNDIQVLIQVLRGTGEEMEK